MPEFDMRLDSDKHRVIELNVNLSSDGKFDVKVVSRVSPSGNKTNYLVVRSTSTPKAFADLEIPAPGFKIPPNVSQTFMATQSDATE